MPPPVSPIHGQRALALGFPEGVHVVRISPAGGALGWVAAEAWAAVTAPRTLLLGWAERAVGGLGWRVMSEPAPGAPGRPCVFDTADTRAAAFHRLAELARLTAPHALAWQGPDEAAELYPEEITIGGRLYAYRPLGADEAAELVVRLRLAHQDGGAAEAAEVVSALRAVLAPAGVYDVLARMQTPDDALTYGELVDALAEIVRRSRAAAGE